MAIFSWVAFYDNVGSSVSRDLLNTFSNKCIFEYELFFNMDIRNYQNGKLIILSKALDTRVKILHLINFVPYFFMANILLLSLLNDIGNLIGLIVLLLAIIAFYIAAYRNANSAISTEKVIVHETELQVIKQGLFNRKKVSYDIAKISNLRHLFKPELARHPLAGDSFDYLGFQTERQLINELYIDEALAFDYEGRIIKFGVNVFSWEYVAFRNAIYQVTGQDIAQPQTMETIETSNRHRNNISGSQKVISI